MKKLFIIILASAIVALSAFSQEAPPNQRRGPESRGFRGPPPWAQQGQRGQQDQQFHRGPQFRGGKGPMNAQKQLLCAKCQKSLDKQNKRNDKKMHGKRK